MRRAAIVVGVVLIAVGVLWLAVGDEALIGGDDDKVVRIDSISPSSAMVGTEIVIRGKHFDAEGNDIGFVLEDTAPDFPMGYHTGVPSEDGRTMRFEIPEYLGACHNHHTEGADDCPSIALPPPVGETEVFVVNESGISNRLAFERTITQLETAQRAIQATGAIDEIFQMLRDELNFPWYESEIRECENGEICVFLEVYNLDLSTLPRPIPDEIAGYEVRLE